MKTSRTARQPNKPPVDIKSEGQRQLIESGKTLDEIAKATDCSRQAALNWRTGAKAPSPETRDLLFAAFGIAQSAWGVMPGAKASLPTSKAPPPSADPSSLEDCLALHRVVREARNAGNLTAAERLKIADTEARLLSLRHRLEQDASMLEDKIVREHTRWRALKRLINQTVAPCPRCSRLLLDEFAKFDM